MGTYVSIGVLCSHVYVRFPRVSLGTSYAPRAPGESACVPLCTSQAPRVHTCPRERAKSNTRLHASESEESLGPEREEQQSPQP